MKTLQDKVNDRLLDQSLFFADRDMHEMNRVLGLLEDEFYTLSKKNLTDEEFRTESVSVLNELKDTTLLTDDEEVVVDDFIHDIEGNRL